MADALLANLNETVFLFHNDEMAMQHKEGEDKNVRDFMNCPDYAEFERVLEGNKHAKEQELHGLYNKFTELNRNVYLLNYNRSERDKLSLSAYYILSCYESELAKYLQILSQISVKIQQYKSANYNYVHTSDYVDLLDYLHNILSLDEQELLKKYLVNKKTCLKCLFA